MTQYIREQQATREIARLKEVFDSAVQAIKDDVHRTLETIQDNSATASTSLFEGLKERVQDGRISLIDGKWVLTGRKRGDDGENVT